MQFGYFDDERREYVITRPDTPLPWINYLGCENYFGIISNTAGGYSFYKDARLRRLTRYRYNNAPLDSGGRYIYLRDDDAALPQFWSPTWQPTRTALDEYQCRHGLGYTTIQSSCAGVKASTCYFIPLEANLEIWQLTLTNQRPTAVNLSIFATVEFCLWDAMDDATNFQRNYSVGEVELEDGVIYHKTEYRERRDHFAFFTCSEKLAGFDTDREAFLGQYRGWDSPLGVERGTLSNSIAHGWQPIGAQHVRLGLQAGEQKNLIFLLGYHENPVGDKFDPPGTQTINKRTVLPIIKRYLQPSEVTAAFSNLQEYWEGLVGKLQVHTPDIHTNRMVNTWNVSQLMAAFNFSRSASYFESGIGRGMGFRDSNQDLLGFVHLLPGQARSRILDLAATQLPTGGAYHQYQPLTKRGNNEVGSGFNDDPLWLVLSVTAYIKETGDWTILDESVPYDNQPGSEESLYVHLQRSMQYSLDRLGPHGLPLIGRADWNDCLNLNCFSTSPGQSFQTTTNKDGKVAESVFIAGLFVLAAQAILQLAEQKADNRACIVYRQSMEVMEKAVWAAGWDGAWFRRAYDDFGEPVGSQVCAEGQIFIEPQGICVMAGLGIENGKARQALDSVAERLATPHGILLHQPGFTHYYLNLGEISSYPPGYKENGSVFCHTNPWIMIAEARLGNGAKAHDYYLRINPSRREEISDLHRCEPYVYAQMIAGREAPTYGEAKNSWLTGTAAWNYLAITQWILGIRPELDGLRLDPCIPPEWDGFTVERSFRGNRLHIWVHNPQHVSQGVVLVTVDGVNMEGNLVIFPSSGGEHQVEVWLGA
ncbi:MAG: glycosyl transferase [Chloroflexi bacterium RBG_13_50_21]|nr:MAG: glycosyl transferase [Chloroflexi bacterium RBG_13_50_21]